MGKEKLDKTTSGLFVARARVGVGLLFGFFALLCFSNPASAASYLTVSSGSGEDLSFGKISPNATGVSATTTDTLTINTNCSVGYSVYVSAQSGKGTSLVNTDPNITTNNTIATSSAGIGSAALLANNTWGLSADSTSATTGQYVGLPTYANALTTPLTTRSDVAEQTTVPIYYGLKVTTALAPGTYTGDILYTVLASPACDVYAIHFNANGGTGDMNNQTIPVGTATPLDANTFTRSDYAFIGWSDSANGKTGTAVNGIGTEADVDYTDGQSVTDIADFGITKELYAIWTPVAGDMQNFSCPSIASGATVYLRDTRDNQVYRVYRIPTDQTYKDSTTIANIAGKCIMTEDLSLGMVAGGDISSTGSNLTLSPDKSNFDANASSSSYETVSYGATETINYVNAANGGTGWNETNSYTNKQYTYGPRSGYEPYSKHVYYSWGAALVACPKGWRLPINDPASAEYSDNANTATPANGIAAIVGNSVDGRTAIQSAPWNFIAGGSFYSSGWRSQGSDGNYWTSTQSSNTNIYYLSFNSTNVYRGSGGKSYGRSVRCIAKDPIPTMQDFDASTSLPSVGDQMELEDARDGKKYTVKRLPDGKVWMMQNLALGMNATTTGLTLTSADTNIDNNTTYYLPPAGKQGSSTIDDSSTLTATDTVNFSSTDQHAKTQFRTKDTSITNDSDTGYYNFYTATLGSLYYYDGKTSGSSTRDICPKGWRLPWTSDSGTTRTTTAEFYVLATSYKSSASWTNNPTGSSTTNPYTSNSTIENSMYLSAAFPLATSTQNNYAGFSYAGYWEGTNTSASNVGSGGYYWSSSVYNAGYGYGLRFNSSYIYPQDYNDKHNGLAVRCVTKDPAMQDFDASTSLPNIGDSVRLEDIRDGKVYTVKRLPDGKVWMMQNLTIGSDGAKTLTPADTNIDDGKTYYLPPAGKQGSSTIDDSSTLTATDTANFTYGSSTDQHAKTQFRTKDASYPKDSDTGYYNFYTATLGFSYYIDGKTSGSSTRDICPKGWRLPKTPNTTSEQVSSIGSDNDFTYLVRQYSTSDWSGSSTGSDSSGYYTTNSTATNSMYLSAASPLATTAQNNYAGFYCAGIWDGTNTSASNVGSNGYYWSSSVYNTDNGYSLVFYSSIIYPQRSSSKYNGYAVRCVAKS